jgi:tetratricopeptide (TPR) repeat protein
MQLPDNWAGRQGRCPQCSSVLSIPATRAAVRPASRESPAPQIGSGVDSRASFSGESEQASSWFNPTWVAALAAGVVLLGIGLFLVLRSGTDSARGDGAAAVTERASHEALPDRDTPSSVFRPQIKAEAIDSDQSSPQQEADTNLADIAAYKAPGAPGVRLKGTATGSIESCNLRDFGVLMPPGASLIEIDGVELPIRNAAELAGKGGVPLVLPLGRHVIRFTKSDSPRVVEPRRWFSDVYLEATAALQENGRWSFDRLLDQSRQTLDRFAEPIVPHCWGNYYWQEGELEAAARQYIWAVQIAPTFAPAYLNLAALAHQRGAGATAHRYLRLADLWNAQNAYGLSKALAQLRGTLGEPDATATEDEPDWYVSTQDELSERDRDMAAVLHSAAEFSPRIAERAKILNNLGAYFEYVGKPDRALESYRSAAAVLGTAKLSSEEQRVIHGILENLARVCRKSDMPEHRRYERLQAMTQGSGASIGREKQ